MIIGSEEIAAINDKSLIKKLTVNDIEDPVSDISENSIYFLNADNKINAFGGNEIQMIDTGIEMDDLEYNPSNGYTNVTSGEYCKIFVLDNQQIIKSPDIGLGQVDYLVYNPSNGYMYAAGNEHREPKKEHDQYSLSNNSRPSSGLQPFAHNQQFNNDAGNGPICCDISGCFTITQNMYQFIIFPFNRTGFLDDYLKVMDLLAFDKQDKIRKELVKYEEKSQISISLKVD